MAPMSPRRRQLAWLITLASSVGCASGMPDFKSWPGSRRLSEENAAASDPEPIPENRDRVASFELPKKSATTTKSAAGKFVSAILQKVDPTFEQNVVQGDPVLPAISGSALSVPALSASALSESELNLADLDSWKDESRVLDLPSNAQPVSPSDQVEKQLLNEVDISLNNSLVNSDPSGLGSRSSSSPIGLQDSSTPRNRVVPRNATQSPENFQDLSEDDMLRLAIAHSPILRSLGIRVVDNPAGAKTVFDPAIAATDPFFGPNAALAQFDSQLFSNLTTQNNDRVFNNATLGGAVQELTQDLVSSETGINRRMTSGGLAQFSAQHLYDDNNRNGNIFPNNWETQWQASLRQPLLRGAGKQFNLIAGPNAQPGFNFSNGIIIARLNNEISDAEFVVAVRKYASELYTAYWELQRSYQEYAAVKEAVEVAEKTWLSVRARRDADVTGGEANKESQARAEYYNYVRQLQVTLGGSAGSGGLYESERRLRRLMGIEVVDDTLLRPVDNAVSARFEFDFDSLGARAMSSRTELRGQSIKVQQQQYRMVAAKNFLLPQLDMIGRYRSRGFGDDLTGNGPRFASAYDDLLSLEHQELEFGVEMGVTAGRRQAHSAVRNARLQLQRERTILDQIEREVQAEIAAAHADVASSYATLETSQLQVQAAQERLQASMAMFAADKLQIEFLLDAQQSVLQARIQLAADQSRYALALVNIGSSTGTLLDDVGIRVQPSHCGRSTIAY
jgi:outer membrane protein TolC